MKKELSFESKEIDIYFYYDSRTLTAGQARAYKKSMSLLAHGFEKFKSKRLKLKDKRFVLNLTLCGDYKIKSLNSQYRNKNKITDVLSFPLQDDIRSGDFDTFSPELELGDLFVCHSVCVRQAKEFQLTYQEEFLHLSTHGFLHLCGYDHEINEKEEQVMENFEEEILTTISLHKKSRA